MKRVRGKAQNICATHTAHGAVFLSADGDGGAVSSRTRGHAGGADGGFPFADASERHRVSADGTVAKGTVLISWPAFTTPGGYAVAAGSLSVQLGRSGAFSASLAPNTGAQPALLYYKVIYQLGDDSVQPA